MSLEELLALLPDNVTRQITAAKLRAVVTALDEGIQGKADADSLGSAATRDVGGPGGVAALGADGVVIDEQLPEWISESGLSATIATQVAPSFAASKISNRLGPMGVDPSAAVTVDLPTLTWSTAQTVTGRFESPASDNMTRLGRRGDYDPVSAAWLVSGDYTGESFFVDGDTFEIGLTETAANRTRVWIFVDGSPVTAAPTLGVATTPGGGIWAKCVWASSKRRRIDVHIANAYGVQGVSVALTATITPTPRQLVVAMVGDSFFNGSSGAPMLQAVACTAGRLLGVDIINASTGGTGYLNAGATQTYGAVGRIARLDDVVPDLIVFYGSVNDSLSGLGAAATACYDTWAAAYPGVPQIVLGIQPTNATDTISSGMASRNDAIRQAALASPHVIAFHDQLGMPGASAIAAWNSGTTYSDGDMVSYKGSVYQLRTPGTTSLSNTPDVSRRWSLMTWTHTGTGAAALTFGAVTFTDAGDVVTFPSAHYLLANEKVTFGTITSTTGITAGVEYFVKSTPTATTMTLSATSGGLTLALTTNGSAASAVTNPTTGGGTRDVMLHPDRVHPMVAGAIALAERLEVSVRSDLADLTA